jgi:hypothetical protein
MWLRPRGEGGIEAEGTTQRYYPRPPGGAADAALLLRSATQSMAGKAKGEGGIGSGKGKWKTGYEFYRSWVITAPHVVELGLGSPTVFTTCSRFRI